MIAAVQAAQVHAALGFDYGLRRVGVASGNRLLGTAEPLTTVEAQGRKVYPLIEALLREWEPQALVVGVPRHPDGEPHAMTAAAMKFAASLRGRFHVAVFEVDERYTSVEAMALGAQDVDAAAAALILEQFFRETEA